MSLIADSLKKATQEKNTEWKAPPDFNVVGNKPASGSARLASLLRFVLLILIPAGVLVYLISVGAFKPRPAQEAAVSRAQTPPVKGPSRFRSPAEIASASDVAPRALTAEPAIKTEDAALPKKQATRKKNSRAAQAAQGHTARGNRAVIARIQQNFSVQPAKTNAGGRLASSQDCHTAGAIAP